MTEWRLVHGFSDYEISEYGSLRRTTYSRTCSPGPRYPWIGHGGYLYTSLRRDGAGYRFAVHFLVVMTFIGPASSPIYEICHNDGDRINNHHTNLRWDTHANNMADAVADGAMRKGGERADAKMTEEIVRLLRTRYFNGGISISDLASEVGVSRKAVSHAINRVTWKHVA